MRMAWDSLSLFFFFFLYARGTEEQYPRHFCGPVCSFRCGDCTGPGFLPRSHGVPTPHRHWFQRGGLGTPRSGEMRRQSTVQAMSFAGWDARRLVILHEMMQHVIHRKNSGGHGGGGDSFFSVRAGRTSNEGTVDVKCIMYKPKLVDVHKREGGFTDCDCRISRTGWGGCFIMSTTLLLVKESLGLAHDPRRGLKNYSRIHSRRGAITLFSGPGVPQLEKRRPKY